jgi:Ca-activated chloride channel family protein
VKVSSFFSKIKEPVLADPTLKFSGDVRVTRYYPNPLPDIFKGSQLVMAGRYTGNGDTLVTLEGTVNGKTRRLIYETRFPEAATENEFIPRLWATRRVGYLLDEIRLHGENSELRDEITQLARKYGIVTPYTAYLIVEDESRRNVPTQLRSMQLFEKDKAAREEASATWNSFQNERGGAGGVASAQQSQSLKMADAAAPAASSGTELFSRRYGLAPAKPGSTTPAPDSRGRLVQYSQQARFVAGKTFFQNDKLWIDAEVQSQTNAKSTKLQFGSAAYFEFASKNPKAGPWLALGQQVQFHLEGVNYEVYAE